MRKLLGDVRLTPKDALVSSRTLEGYRIAAVHSSVVGDDPNDPGAQKYHAFVLRKFRKTKMNLAQIVKLKTMSDNMARFLALTTVGGLTTICAGPTASGKTSLLNALLQSVPPSNRVVLIQNPSEIDMRFKDATGRCYNDVIHLEATEKENPTTHDATMSNLMAHTLRLSPVYVVLGELRSNREFSMGMMIMGAGHPLYASIHASDSIGAINRYLRAYMADSQETIETALPGLTDLLDIIVIQKIMRDGTRKVLQISEVLGVDPNNSNRPLVNDLYIFEPDGDPIYDGSNNIISIPGKHKRVGKLEIVL
ncbi:CpaF/VirB11 family protein, partial [Patescibacteria group bacterium]|nr:CpaF/VirB11 family protein [Patescibacteria group bacterium]